MSRVRDIANILSGGSSAIATDAEITSATAYIPSNVAGKNFIINGGMDIWQRGISITNGYPIYGADRWLNYGNGNGVMSRQLVSDTTNLPGIQYCLRLQRTSGSTSTNALYMSQSIETMNSIPLAGKRVTLSYYARKGANFSGSAFSIADMLVVETVVGTGTDQNCIAGFTGGTNPSGGVSYQPITSAWIRYSFSFIVPATSTEIGFNFFFNPTGTAGANDYFEITGIQLEIGSVATPFSRAGGDIQGELVKCQRYFQSYGGSTVYERFSAGFTPATTSAYFVRSPLVQMRSTPSLSYSALSDWNVELPGVAGVVPTALDVTWSGTSVQELVATFASNATYGGNKGCLFRANNTTNARLYYSAEI